VKKIKYTLNIGTPDKPVLTRAQLDFNEANLSIAEEEAYGGEYTIEDEGPAE
jgi:hypothetical protein